MKTLLLLLSICSFITCSATTYYFSSGGNDNNQGTSEASPFQTLAKLNLLQLNAGDNVVFNKGDIFYGSIKVKANGSPGNPVTFASYGTGVNPIITGLTAVQQWVQKSNNIWESTSPVSSLNDANMIVINNKNTAMGRYPNGGYFLYSNPTTNPYTISCANITSSGINWTGAELVANNTTYTIIRNTITSQTGDIITFNHNKGDIDWQKAPGYLVPKCFIQNDIRTLDADNEWYFDPSTKKLSIYKSSMPTGVQVSSIEILVDLTSYGRNYVTINGIDFFGANKAAIDIHNSKNITISNCNFMYSGINGIYADYGSNQDSISITGCTFNQTNNCAIRLSLNCTNAVINNNIVTNTGMIPGMMLNSGSVAIAISATGAGSIISNNIIDSVGYSGIQLLGNNTQVYNNVIKNFCMQLLDGAGIYTYNGYAGAEENGLQIYNNIVTNASSGNEGIYLDDKTNNAKVFGNTVAYCNWGIYLHNTWNTDVHNNTCFANNIALTSVSDNNTVTARNNNFHNNNLVAKNATDKLEYFQALNDNEMASDNNYLIYSNSNSNPFQMKYKGSLSNNSLTQWQSSKSLESHSMQAAKEVSDPNDIMLEYNAGASPKTITLTNTYVDAAGKTYNGSVSLLPFSSIVLIKK